MIQRLEKHGDQLALILDEALLRELNIDPVTAGTPLHLHVEAGRLVVRPAVGDDELDAALADTNQRYGPMLKRLAE